MAVAGKVGVGSDRVGVARAGSVGVAAAGVAGVAVGTISSWRQAARKEMNRSKKKNRCNKITILQVNDGGQKTDDGYSLFSFFDHSP